MNRNIAIVALSVALLACLYFCVYHWITADASAAMKSERPELEWLRREYELSDDQFSVIREKHEAHDVVCQQLCRDLVKAQKRLNAVISEHPGLIPEVEEALALWASQRERCREATLTHMYDVSSVMDEEDAARYRKRIFKNLIVPGHMPHVGKDGEFHEKLIEHADPDPIDTATLENGETR